MKTERTVIQKYATAIISGLMEKVKSLSDLKHNLTKGELRELFVNEILSSFLTDQFGIGSGIIINQAGLQSNQNDIIIYDNRVLPPFIKQQNLGVYPVESVIGVLEVKTTLTRKNLIDTETKFAHLRNDICSPVYSYYLASDYIPLCGLIGFYGNGAREIKDHNGAKWLNENFKNLFGICLVGKFSWLRTNGWSICHHDPTTFEESKRFIAALLDNIRTKSNRPPYKFDEKHKDWLSIYLRDQDGIKNHFKPILTADQKAKK
jgi:hypothetical protein